ncbi:unnamed protein product, partial [marine sediment metagenome]
VAFDSKKPTFRHKIFKDYKSDREKMPEDLASQFNLIYRVLDVFNIPKYQVEGYEADDLLGTLATQAKDKGIEVLIVTGDKDALQLVSENVKVIFTVKGISDVNIYGPEEVIDKYGIGPNYIADYFGLIGDKIDNIPGISGIGKKSAAKLINEFGFLEQILDRVDEIPAEKIKEKLKQDSEMAILSKNLATIDCNSPIRIDIEKCNITEIFLNNF